VNFPVRPTLSDPGWEAWFAAFPDLPLPNEYALRWTLSRVSRAASGLPSFTLLPAGEMEVLHDWVRDYMDQFARDQRPPLEGFDVGGLLGAVSGVAGIAALGFAPVVGAGLAVSCGLAFARKEYRRHTVNQRRKLADAIERELATIERALR
jgi:hypothetical protein